ncbi:hypothetical protein [Streptomyces sp. NPDC048445]|uniref:tripartite tricarboxylate transporter TctB family protein n=1 Tax=Streptomyces sp. NPDC048445 TaxID=3365553 RepID=UPI00371160D7
MNPAVGNIPADRVTTNYNSDDLPSRVSGGLGVLVSNTTYDAFSRSQRLEYGATLGKKVYKSQIYDEHTGRMTRQITDRDIAPQRVDDTSYSYDPAGNVTGVTSVSGQDAQKSTDTQCFKNDPLGRLTEAWTAKTACAASPSKSTVGGPDAYWQSYGYDALGNRTEQTDHAAMTTGTDATTTYTHPAPGAGLPHGVQQAKVNGGPDNGRTSTFEYDETGNTTKRTVGTTTQNLTWDPEGHLATLTEAGKTSSYLYDADGNRLVTKNADGSSTLTLPDGDRLDLAVNGTKTCTRYYTHNGEQLPFVRIRSPQSTAFAQEWENGSDTRHPSPGSIAVARRAAQTRAAIRCTTATPFKLPLTGIKHRSGAVAGGAVMRELRGSYRVHFGLALVLCGVDLLCMVSTWLPGEGIVPKWLVEGLFVLSLLVFVVALIRSFTTGAAAQLMGRRNADRLFSYILLLPPVLKFAYAFIICLAVLGFATGAGTAEDAQEDASGYYYTHWDKTGHPQQSVRVELTESKYYEVLKSQLRVFSAGPAIFYAFSSFLVLASASAAAGRISAAPDGSYGSAEEPRWS